MERAMGIEPTAICLGSSLSPVSKERISSQLARLGRSVQTALSGYWRQHFRVSPETEMVIRKGQ